MYVYIYIYNINIILYVYISVFIYMQMHSICNVYIKYRYVVRSVCVYMYEVHVKINIYT